MCFSTPRIPKPPKPPPIPTRDQAAVQAENLSKDQQRRKGMLATIQNNGPLGGALGVSNFGSSSVPTNLTPLG